jgi:GNAT superfamily N-acetyltransferase
MSGVVRVTDSPLHVSVMIVDRQLCLGSTEANPYPLEQGWWWLARLKVQDRHQGHGLGTLLLLRLLDTLSSKDIKGLIVSPGGYGSDEKELFRFYKNRGFEDGKEGELRWYRKSPFPKTKEVKPNQRGSSSLTSHSRT